MSARVLAFAGAARAASLSKRLPGALGGLRGLLHVRQVLTTPGMLVIPEQLAVSRAHEAFDGQGRLADPRQQAALDRIAHRLVEASARLGGQTGAAV